VQTPVKIDTSQSKKTISGKKVRKFFKAKKGVVDKEIQSMLEKNVLREVQPIEGQFLSTIFVRPKKGENKYRPILNLKKLNAHMPYIHFKMEGMKNVTDLPNQGDFMIKIDLKEAYWHIPIHPSSQKYLRFDRKGNYTK